MATVSRIDKITGLFRRISSLFLCSFAIETYCFIDPTIRSHPICIGVAMKLYVSFAKETYKRDNIMESIGAYHSFVVTLLVNSKTEYPREILAKPLDVQGSSQRTLNSSLIKVRFRELVQGSFVPEIQGFFVHMYRALLCMFGVSMYGYMALLCMCTGLVCAKNTGLFGACI